MINPIEVKSGKKEFTEYCTRYVRIFRQEDPLTLEKYYYVEVSDLGLQYGVTEVNCKNLQEAEKKYNAYMGLA